MSRGYLVQILRYINIKKPKGSLHLIDFARATEIKLCIILAILLNEQSDDSPTWYLNYILNIRNGIFFLTSLKSKKTLIHVQKQN